MDIKTKLFFSSIAGISTLQFAKSVTNISQNPELKSKFEDAQPQTDEDIEGYRKKSVENEKKRYEKKYDKQISQLPNMKKSPKDDPCDLDILQNYTAFSDIKLYSTFQYQLHSNPKLKKDVIRGKAQVPRTRLHYIKPNTLITLSLECERTLQNIYIDVQTLKNILKKKGHYEPPAVIIKYYGSILFKLRANMPMKTGWIEDYEKNNRKYVSLYDLYFDYHSNLPYIHPLFYDFFVQTHYKIIDTMQNTIPEYGGEVHQNHRELESKYLVGDEKVVIVDPEPNTEKNYDYIWNRAYTRKHLVKYVDLSEYDWNNCNLSEHLEEGFKKNNTKGTVLEQKGYRSYSEII